MYNNVKCIVFRHKGTIYFSFTQIFVFGMFNFSAINYGTYTVDNGTYLYLCRVFSYKT